MLAQGALPHPLMRRQDTCACRRSASPHGRPFVKLKTCLGRGSRRENEFARHCERSEAIQRAVPVVDCFVTSLLAMTRDMGSSQ